MPQCWPQTPEGRLLNRCFIFYAREHLTFVLDLEGPSLGKAQAVEDRSSVAWASSVAREPAVLGGAASEMVQLFLLNLAGSSNEKLMLGL